MPQHGHENIPARHIPIALSFATFRRYFPYKCHSVSVILAHGILVAQYRLRAFAWATNGLREVRQDYAEW
jgi:hypothetical protein